MFCNTIRQIEEKNVANEITHMVWSDRMDLIAYSTVKGEVSLHRLTWTRAWNILPRLENLSVKGLAWRPDGKVLAIAYSNGEVTVVNIENKVICNCVKTFGDISCLYWVEEKNQNKNKSNNIPQAPDDKDQLNYMEYIDFSSSYLPETPMLYCMENIHSTEENQLPNFLHEQSELNILLIGTKEGIVHVIIFGAYPCVKLNINEYLGYSCSIENIIITEDLTKLLVTVKDEQNEIKIVLIDSNIFKNNTEELFAISLKYVKIMYLFEVISTSIRNITETWENILLEMDNKLSKFALNCPEGGVTAAFLDLLMFGIYSDNMEQFLLQDLTRKGLEKFGRSIEMSYSTIQELLLKYVTKYGQCITYHLSELRGIARLKHKYKVSCLQEDDISDGIASTGSFLIKAGEMHQIINQSIITYKAFFRWLYTAIMNLSDEQIPPEIPKMTQQDLTYLTEFFQNFDHIGEKNNKGKNFTMERLGQYLVGSSLPLPSKMDQNEWSTFLNENECLKNDVTILKHDTDLSLVQQFDKMKDTLNKVFLPSENSIKGHLKMLKLFKCLNAPHKLEISPINFSKEIVLYSFFIQKKLILLEINTKHEEYTTRSRNFHFNNQNQNDFILSDVKFYSPSTLSLLLQDTNQSSILYQFPITAALNHLSNVDLLNGTLNDITISSVNGLDLSPVVFKNIEMVVTQLAVSGSRKVSIVLSENKRKVKLFEMENEEEDEDAEMSMNISNASKI